MAKYTKNESFFETPNTENCYWAGFIAADGCVRRFDKGQQGIQIKIHHRDVQILQAFKEATEANAPITEIKEKVDKINFKQKESHSVVLTICSADKWASDLCKYWNITQNKSLTLEPPNLTNLDHKLSYIVGFIDGDGHIGLSSRKGYEKKYIQFGITGNLSVLTWIAESLFLTETKYNSPITVYKTKSRAYCIQVGKLRAYNILKRLQEVRLDFKLQRKWNKVKIYEEECKY